MEDQQRLIDTCHLGICHADILNSTAINIHEQCFVHHRPIVAIQLKFKIIRIPIVRPVHSTAVVQVIDCMAVAIKISTKIAIISRIIILHKCMTNRFPLKPSGSVWIGKISQVDICRQFDILTSKILFVCIRTFC